MNGSWRGSCWTIYTFRRHVLEHGFPKDAVMYTQLVDAKAHLAARYVSLKLVYLACRRPKRGSHISLTAASVLERRPGEGSRNKARNFCLISAPQKDPS